MKPTGTYDRFPAGTVIIAVAVSIAIYVLGTLIIASLSLSAAMAYVILIGWLEYRIMSRSCVNCFYYGKQCAFGKGWLCSKIMHRGIPDSFADRQISWRDVIPDFMVFLLPLAGATLLFINGFSWSIAIYLLFLILFFFAGTALVRGKLSCSHCSQRVLGCPAERLFNQSGATDAT